MTALLECDDDLLATLGLRASALAVVARERPSLLAARAPLIRQWHAEGRTLREVAAALGLSYVHTCQVCRSLGLRFRRPVPVRTSPVDPARALLVRRMYAEGATLAVMGAAMGVSRERARQLCVRVGLNVHERLVTRRNARRQQREAQAMAAWVASAPPLIASVLRDLAMEGLRLAPLPPRCGTAQEKYAPRYCTVLGAPWIIALRVSRITRATNRAYPQHRFYRARASGAGPYTHLVIAVGDGRRFVIPREACPVGTVYIPETHDGRWAPFRDAWPWGDAQGTSAQENDLGVLG